MTVFSFKELKVGMEYETKNSGYCKVIEIGKTSLYVKVIFLVTGYTVIVKFGNLKLGKVKDPYYPRVLGKGYIGEGFYRGSYASVDTPAYVAWRNMLGRCYDVGWVGVYKGCSVHKEWLNFQTFAMWFYQNWVHGYHLDKDIKVLGNKVYSKDTCLFVSEKDNILKAVEYKMYEFTLYKGKETIKYSNQGDAASFIGVDVSCICRVLNGKARSVKGWSLLKEGLC